jgi:hypothetical protein
MNCAVKIVTLAVSHLLVFAVGATWFAGSRTRAMFEAAGQDPLYRIGVAMTQLTDENATTSLDTDLTLLSGTVRAPATQVIRLAVLLEQGHLNDAGIACKALAWPHCDPQTLGQMRKALQP